MATYISESTLVQIMACCLTAPKHYLNQCWLIISEVLWHSDSPDGSFSGNAYIEAKTNGRYFKDDILKCIFLNENAWISIKISLNFVPKVQINNIPTLVQIMAWRRPGDKPLSDPMMASLPTHICVTLPQWVKISILNSLVPNLVAKILATKIGNLWA